MRRGLKREEKDKTSTQKVRKCTKGEKFLACKHAFVLMLPLPKLWNNSSRWQAGRDNMLQGPGAGAALSSWREVYSFKWSVLSFIPLTANNNDDLRESRDERSRTLPELPSLPSHIFRLSVSVRLGRRCGYHWPRSSSVRLSLLRFHISRSDILWWKSLLRTASSRAGPQSYFSACKLWDHFLSLTALILVSQAWAYKGVAWLANVSEMLHLICCQHL